MSTPRHVAAPPPARARRFTAAAAVTAMVASLTAVSPAAPAHAAISAPADGATVSGLVAITEDRGGQGPCDTPRTRFEVRDAAGAVVFDTTLNGSGPRTATWDSVGQPLGEVTIRTFTRDTRRSGFLNLGCSTDGEVQRGQATVTLDNGVRPDVTLPSSVVTGEALPVTVTTRVDGTGVNSRVLADREVTVAIPGLDTRTVTTGADGTADLTFDLPVAPIGDVTVEATTSGDAAYAPRTGDATTTTTRRTTATFYQGETRGDPGRTARLAAQVLDVTPDSSRFGQPLPGLDVDLALEDAVRTATTTASGRVQAGVTVTGAERITTARAAFGGDDTYLASDDEKAFFVGDATPLPADEPSTGVVGGLLGGLLGGVTSTLQTVTAPLLGSVDDLLAALSIDLSAEGALADLTTLAEDGLLHLLSPGQLTEGLDLLHGELTDGAGALGDPIDDTLDRLLDGLGQLGPLGELTDTVRFDWRAIHVTDDGATTREFQALLGVPEPLDVTGDGQADVLANLTLASGIGGLDLSGVDGLLAFDLELPGQPTITPRLEIAKLPGAPEQLPLSLQALVTLPGSDQEIRVGYDTRDGDAPDGFRADVALTDDGGAGLDLATRSDAPIAITAALVDAGADDTDATPGATATGDLDEPGLDGFEPRPGEQRFGIRFDPAPRDARLALDLDGTQDLGAAIRTDQPTVVGLSLVDDPGTADGEVFVVDGLLDAVDGELAASLTGDDDGALRAEFRSPDGLDRAVIEGRTVAGGATVQDLLIGLTDVPSDIAFSLSADGQGTLDASAPIGIFEAGLATNRTIATLDDDAYLRLLDEDDETSSVALRLPGFEGLTLDLDESLALEIALAPTPLRAVVDSDGLSLDALIADAPNVLGLALDTAGTVQVSGSAPIELITITGRAADGLLQGATDLDLRIEDIPALLTIDLLDDGAAFGTGGQPIGLLEIAVHDGTPLALADDGDGLLLEQGDDRFALSARISGLRAIEAAITDVPELFLDTVAGEVFDVQLRDVAADGSVSTIGATIDALVPELRLALVDDGSGALFLDYSASEPTNSLAFDLGDISGSIGGPLPEALLICFADDESCLPDAGIVDPGLGSIRLAASDYTTVNVASADGLSASDLRVRTLDLTGELGDDGGQLYLNTTRFGDDCDDGDRCIDPILGGQVDVDLGDISVRFRPGNGFSAIAATTDLEVTTVLGVPTGLRRTGRVGTVTCAPDTDMRATARILGINITLNVTGALC